MALIYIVSLHQIEAKKITNTLNEMALKLGETFEYEILRPQQMQEKVDINVDLIVFSNPHVLNLDMKHQMATWRKKGMLAPILLLSRVNSEQDIIEMKGLQSFVLLEKPYIDKDLQGIAAKLLRDATAAQRKFRRFSANQKVQLASYQGEFKTETKVQNISLGGVCIEGNCAGLQVGDLLHMNFTLDRINSERMMSGRVVWIEKDSTAGVEFVKDQEVYGHIMKTIG